MMPVQYYWDIIDHIEENDLPANLAFTSNLWPFYKKPEKWKDLFNHPLVGVTTSFQYGNARLKGDYTPYTESEFWDVSDAFLEHCGYRPDFIAVITEENDDTVLKTVALAKAMGVEVKVNYAYGSGDVKEVKHGTMGNKDQPYRLSRIYRHYLDIYNTGLMQWEYNTKQMIDAMQNKSTTCPLNRSCDSGIRAIQPSGRYYSCGAFGDDDEYGIDFKEEMEGAFHQPLQRPELMSMKDACFTCPMFDICNGCKKTISELKTLNMVETHCLQMKELAPEIIEAAGMSDELEVTPYVREHTHESTLIFSG